MRGRNTILPHYWYRVDPELGKYICAIHRIPCACPAYVYQFDKYWLPTIDPSSKPGYSRIENCYHTKTPEHFTDQTIMELLDNRTPQVELDNIHAFILAVISTKSNNLLT